jgi:hypothetical protein
MLHCDNLPPGDLVGRGGGYAVHFEELDEDELKMDNCSFLRERFAKQKGLRD